MQLNNMVRAVVFDLDGTLVDSSPGILASLDHAFRANGVRPTGTPSDFLIGPPVREIVNILCPQTDTATRDSIIESFTRHYDSYGYLRTVPYDGIDQMLKQLLDARVYLAIVTNKREQPTKLIVNLLGWSNCFSSIYSPDSVQPPSHSKAALIGQFLRDKALHPRHCVYIGDRSEDWHSARDNSIRFGWAQWGYSLQTPNFDDDSFILSAPNDKMILASLDNALKY